MDKREEILNDLEDLRIKVNEHKTQFGGKPCEGCNTLIDRLKVKIDSVRLL